MSTLDITSGGIYTVNESNSTITISTTEPVTITGSADTQLSEVVISTTVDNVNLTIDNLNIKNVSNTIITVGDGSENTLNITGTNIFEITSGPGACVNVGGGLTINGTGSFKGTTINAAVIGINNGQQKPDSDITIESGTFDLTCRGGACAIGGAGARGNAIGNINITGTANITASAPAGHASPIGASYWGSCGDILITGDAKITSTSGQHSAAIGGASLTTVGNITINGNAEVNAINNSQVDDSAAIGSGLGSMVQSLGDIVIGGNAKVTATSGLGLAIDNIEYHRENQQYGTNDEGDYPIINENKIIIGENATFTGHSGDIYTTTTINGTEFKAAEINYNASDGLTYSGGSEIDKEALENTLLEITSGGSYTIAQGSFGKILINTTDAVTLTGGDYDLEEIQIIGQSDNINLTINDLQITNKAVSASVIKFGSGADNKLTITGDNDFNVIIGNNAGVNIGGGGTIGGTGSIKILTLNGAAIGTNGEEDLSTSNIVINSGTFDLQSKSGACGLGGAGNGSKIGNITITGTAHVVSKTPQGYAAAIGSAYRGTVGDILINGDATVSATSGLQSASIGSAVYCKNGDITIGGRASVVANTTSNDVKDAAIGGTYGDQVASIGDIKIIEDATVIANSAHGLALDNRLYVEGETYASSYWIVNPDSGISISGDNSTANQSTVILTNGNTSDSVIIGNRAYQGGKMVFYDGNLAMTGNWTSLESGGWEYNSVVQTDYTQNIREDKFANFSLSGGNLKDEDGDGAPDGVGIGSIIYVQKSGAHTNVRNLSGNVIYNGDALGVEGDDSYNIEAVSPIDLSEEFPLEGYYITNPHVTAMRLISDGATISPRGDSGTGTVPADWYSFDDSGGTVTFMDGSYCLYPESQFFTRNYTKLTIANSNSSSDNVSGQTNTSLSGTSLNNGVKVTTADDLIQKISNLTDDYEITIESGINVGERINFETSGDGVIVVKTTANTGKYSLDADSEEWQYQRYSIYGGNDFTFVFGENGSVVGMEDFDGTLETDDTTLSKGTWVTLDGGGFKYTGNATNNPSKSTTFTVSGESITSTDNLSIVINKYFVELNGNRVVLSGLSGNATVDDVDLGISGDSNYSAHFSEINDQLLENTIVLMAVSDGATVDSNYTAGVDNNGLITFSDGKHSVLTSDNPRGKVTSIEASNGGNGFELNVSDGIFGTIGGLNDGYAITIHSGDNIGDELTFKTDGGNGTIAIADETLSAGGENNFTVEFDDEEKIIFGRWSTIDGGFVYSGHAFNNFAKTADVSLIGSELKDTNGDGAPDNISVNAFNYSTITGVMAFMSGFSGEVTLNNKDVGVIGDDDYEVHFTAKLIDNPSEAAKRYAETKEVSGISTGATINPNENDIIGFDENAKAHVGDVERFAFYNKNHKSGGSPHAHIGIDNNGAGADLTVEDNLLTEIGGLKDGYSVSVTSSDNVSNELIFKTDGGKGTIAIADETLSFRGDDEFTLEFDDQGKLSSVKGFDGSIGNWKKINGGFVYNGRSINNFTVTADVSLIGSDLKDNDGDGDPDNINVSLTSSDIVGVMAIAAGLSGEVTINNKAVGVSGDDDYEVHFLAKLIDNPSEAAKRYAETKEVSGISTGATINPNENDIIGFDENAKAHVGDVERFAFYNKNHKSGGSPHAHIGIDNNGAGADLTVEDNLLTEIGGLKDGYSVSVTSSDNVSNELIFKTDGGNGTIILNDEIYSLTGDDNFTFELNSDGSVKSLKNFSGKILPTVETIAPHWSSSESTFTYIRSGTTAGYTLVDDKITYNEEIIGEQFTLRSSKNTKVVTGGSVSEKIIPEKNTVLICDNVLSHIDMTNADNVTIIAYAGTVTLDNYDASTDAAILIPNVDNIFDALQDDSIQFVGNQIKIDSSTGVRINNSADSIIVNLITADRSSKKVGVTTDQGIILDASKEHGNFLLKGDDRSTITAGNGNDTILAASNNSVDAGDGRNQIYLAQEGDSTVVMSDNGRSTVHGFRDGFDSDSDVIRVDDFNDLQFKFDNNGLLLTSDDARLKVDGIGLTTADSGEKILLTDDTKIIKTVVAQNNQTIIVDDEEANAFFGKRSGLNFSDCDGNVEINLSDGTVKTDGRNAVISGFNKLQGGSERTTLIGDSGRNTLTASNGYTSIWGGAGNDKLIGNGDSSDKDGRTTFFFFAGDGRDVISNFTFLTSENRYDGIDDSINVGDSYINNAYRSGNNVVIAFDQNSYLTLEDAVGKDFRIANMIVKVDKDIAYDGLADCYIASGGSSLTVDSTVDSAEIWLDNSHGTQFLGDIRTLDASAVEGNTSLVGNEFDNTIIAGQDNSSLWGGYYSTDDLLIGGDSRNTFFYFNGNGRDTVSGVNDGDDVILSDISLDQIISANISADAVSLNFNDGGSLQINSAANVTYQLANGLKYSANHQNLKWVERK